MSWFIYYPKTGYVEEYFTMEGWLSEVKDITENSSAIVMIEENWAYVEGDLNYV